MLWSGLKEGDGLEKKHLNMPESAGQGPEGRRGTSFKGTS